MGDLPLKTRPPVNHSPNASEPNNALGEIPAWLAARRAKVETATVETSDVEPIAADSSDLEIEFGSVPEEQYPEQVTAKRPNGNPIMGSASVKTDLPVPPPPPFQIQPVTERRSAPSPKQPPPFPSLIVAAASKSLEAKRQGKGPHTPALVVADEAPPVPEKLTWNERIQRWARSEEMTGVWVSLLVHTVLLTVLALIVIGGGAVHQGLDIFGEVGEPGDDLMGIVLDSPVTIESGTDSPGPEFSDVSQVVNSESANFSPSEQIRGGQGNTGKNGSGDSDGDAMMMGPVNVPTYAVTKGSFSAWTEPRDPVPDQLYEIIIQVRLPSNVRTYRGNDLSGGVVGTDGYKQAIRFRRDETFPVVNGSVRIKLIVPGAARLVRDTIKIESKLLKEKQNLEIEF